MRPGALGYAPHFSVGELKAYPLVPARPGGSPAYIDLLRQLAYNIPSASHLASTQEQGPTVTAVTIT